MSTVSSCSGLCDNQGYLTSKTHFELYSQQHSSVQPIKPIMASTTNTSTTTSTELKLKPSQSEIELAKCLNGRTFTEPLLKNYSCAWYKDGSILVHGRVYITCYHICFYSNILGWETKLSINFKDLTDITKQKTARVFSNAITITTIEREYFLTSFLHRNNAYRVLQLVWKYSTRGIRLTKEELSQLIKTKIPFEETVDHDDDGDCMIDGYIKQTPSTITTNSSSTSNTSNSMDNVSQTTITEKIDDNIEDDINNNFTVTRHPEQLHYSFINDSQSGTNTSSVIYNMSPAVIINIIILILIVLLMISMLTIICKLCELDPNLKTWLSWQPWCLFICN